MPITAKVGSLAQGGAGWHGNCAAAPIARASKIAALRNPEAAILIELLDLSTEMSKEATKGADKDDCPCSKPVTAAIASNNASRGPVPLPFPSSCQDAHIYSRVGGNTVRHGLDFHFFRNPTTRRLENAGPIAQANFQHLCSSYNSDTCPKGPTHFSSKGLSAFTNPRQ